MSVKKIPKIIHQIWIGPKTPPLTLMNSWKEKHPDYEYIFWNETEFQKRNLQLSCLDKINLINEINGKADIIRWEILYKYGGIFIDADSICIEPFDEFFHENTGFASFENEICRKGLVATGTMGFIPQHPICKDIIEWINSNESTNIILNYRAWYSVGPACFTNFLNTKKYEDIKIYPSYFFLPHHFTGETYKAHKKVYAFQEWGTAKSSYDNINTVVLPCDLKPPPQEKWVSLLISSYNTPKKYIHECLESIREQIGHIGIELVWLNDGSTQLYTDELEEELKEFEKNTRFCKLIYERSFINEGLYISLSKGVLKCSHSLIFRMDSDDVMFPQRIIKQYQFMLEHPEIKICSAGLRAFHTNNIEPDKKIPIKDAIHQPIITLDNFKKNHYSWFMNQPSLCFYKQSVIEVGNYGLIKFHKNYMEDYALELRFLKKYGAVYNMPDVLVYYRMHANQMTYLHQLETDKLKEKMIQMIIYNS